MLRLSAHGFCSAQSLCRAVLGASDAAMASSERSAWAHKCSCVVLSLCSAVVQSGAAGRALAQTSTHESCGSHRAPGMRRSRSAPKAVFASVLQAASESHNLAESKLQTPRNESWPDFDASPKPKPNASARHRACIWALKKDLRDQRPTPHCVSRAAHRSR